MACVSRCASPPDTPNCSGSIAERESFAFEVLTANPATHKCVKCVLIALQGMQRGDFAWLRERQRDSIDVLGQSDQDDVELLEEAIDPHLDRRTFPVCSGLADLVWHALITVQQCQQGWMRIDLECVFRRT